MYVPELCVCVYVCLYLSVPSSQSLSPSSYRPPFPSIPASTTLPINPCLCPSLVPARLSLLINGKINGKDQGRVTFHARDGRITAAGVH